MVTAAHQKPLKTPLGQNGSNIWGFERYSWKNQDVYCSIAESKYSITRQLNIAGMEALVTDGLKGSDALPAKSLSGWLTKNQMKKPLKAADKTTKMRIGQANRMALSKSVPVKAFLMRTATPGQSISFTKDIPRTASFSWRTFTGIRRPLPGTTLGNACFGRGETCLVFV